MLNKRELERKRALSRFAREANFGFDSRIRPAIRTPFRALGEERARGVKIASKSLASLTDFVSLLPRREISRDEALSFSPDWRLFANLNTLEEFVEAEAAAETDLETSRNEKPRLIDSYEL